MLETLLVERTLNFGEGSITSKEDAVVHENQVCLHDRDFGNEELEQEDTEGDSWGRPYWIGTNR
jgi:hypothetical protein